jgi:hypothetical protein
MSSRTNRTIVRFLLLAVLSLTFGLTYIHNSLWVTASMVRNIATFNVGMPHKTRILIPYILYHVFPHALPDTFWFRMTFCGLFALLSLYVFPLYWQRVTDTRLNPNVLALILLAMMIAHYSLNKWDQVFYIYDIPSIAFSMYAFLLLTSEQASLQLAGGVAFVVFSFSKETIVSAGLQALAYWALQWWQARPRNLNTINRFPVAVIMISGALIVVTRALLAYRLGANSGDMYGLLHENGIFRPYANYLHVIQNTYALESVFLFGCGMLLWLPIGWRMLNARTKWLMVASVPPLLLLFVVDNFIELRCYSELLPLMACGFGQVLVRSASVEGSDLPDRMSAS